MINPQDASQTYLRFLNLVNAVRALPSFPSLDAVEERVLNGLAAVWATGANVTVLEAMRLSPDASPSTVHRRLKQLQEKGVILLREDASDSRPRIIEPTGATHAWFAKLGQCLKLATRDERAVTAATSSGPCGGCKHRRALGWAVLAE